MKVLSKRQILMLHSMLVARSGGMDGVRDEGLLESAINTPLQTFAGGDMDEGELLEWLKAHIE